MINIITLAIQRVNLKLDPSDHQRAKALAAVLGKDMQTYLKETLQDHIVNEATTLKIDERQHSA